MKIYLRVAVVSAFFLIVGIVYAGGPFVVDTVTDSGTVQQWNNSELVWYSEDGDLSNTVDNATAKQWVSDALNRWAGSQLQNENRSFVSTASITVRYGGSVGLNIDETNYADYISATAGPTVIIFDKTGEITKDLAPGSYRNIPGLSNILLSDSSGKKIIRGVVIFNGLVLDEGTLTNNEFQGTILHELGHLFNLDHTQVNFDIANACDRGGTCVDANYIPTMYPELKTYLQGSKISIDDKVTMSWIYPNTTFQDSFCTITGEIQDEDGRPLQGVNVIARRVGDGEILTKEDARSMVSGVLFSGCSKDSTGNYNYDGRYYLKGIVPGKNYEVFYEELTSQYTGMSGFEPLANPPEGFASASIGDTTVSCSNGGETINMPTVQIAVTNPCSTTNGGSGGGGSSGSSSSGCSLIIKNR